MILMPYRIVLCASQDGRGRLKNPHLSYSFPTSSKDEGDHPHVLPPQRYGSAICSLDEDVAYVALPTLASL